MPPDMIVLGNAEQAESCWHQREVLLFCTGAGHQPGGGCPGPSAWGASHPSCRGGCAAMAPVKVEEALTTRATAAVAAADKRDETGQLLWQNSRIAL